MGQIKFEYQEVIQKRRELIRYASRITGDRDLAEEVVQEAYLRLGEMAAKQPLARPGGYLARIVRNLAINRLWRSRRENEAFVPDGEAALANIVADQPSPEQMALANDQYARLEAALAELPNRTRIAVEMSRFGGAKLREIAEELGVSVTVAHELVIDGIAHCRSRLR
ncbi:sigma-70 family RNA polymerase sigma factor [Sphingomonas sanguinis]|uniref:sigma-70 family RNA polymerase sigma factor n=1 Tax=Sphingomonas sp. LC-1 TaxID=3110957 RepID=UPI0021BB46C6|nr:sigma-70 family RNA polymerase sigma factor [Sphingomonas sp. LC-1]MCT8003147.1 sigma-70 family RNA polymerase sigma factor [Sphingomonas sp. LC-1]